jgi:tetratricopeptide (TPR) repeat protein
VVLEIKHRARGAIFFCLLLGAMGALSCTLSATDEAMSLSRQHRDDDAIALLRADLAKHPGDLRARKLLIRLLAFTSQLPAARVEIDELAHRLPEGDPTPWIELGHAYELTHQFEEALASYDEAASRAPASPDGPREGGMRCARWGEAEEARPRLEEAIRRGAHDAETFHMLGLVRIKLGDLDAAAEAYRQGLAADPKAAEMYLGLATVAVIKNDGPGALAAYDALLKRRPQYGPAELGRAWAFAKMGKKDEAKRALDRAEELGAPAANIAKQRAALASPSPAVGAPPALPESVDAPEAPSPTP